MEDIKNKDMVETKVEETCDEGIVSNTTEDAEDVADNTAPVSEPIYADCILYNRNDILEVIGLLNNMEIRGVQNATVISRINEVLDTHGTAVKVPVQNTGIN